MADLLRVIDALRDSWGPDTAQDSIGSNPASGQCCVSSLVIQSHFGGNLLRASMIHPSPTMRPVVHYWNELPDGTWLDVTRSQFSSHWFPAKVTVNPDEKLYWFEDTKRKYDILSARVYDKLAEAFSV